jgi:hypothetical protein
MTNGQRGWLMPVLNVQTIENPEIVPLCCSPLGTKIVKDGKSHYMYMVRQGHVPINIIA